MKISEVKSVLETLDAVNFKLPDGSTLPPHFHITEIGLITKHFIDCGGTERKETLANFQLWEAGDYDHRLAPKKFLHILDLCKKVLGDDDYEIEVEYQQNTIGKFGLKFDGTDFILTNKQTACLAQDACGITDKPTQEKSSCCSPANGCC